MDILKEKLNWSLALVGTILSFVVGHIGVFFAVLLSMMAIDYITGLMAAFVNKEVSSRVGKEGLIKKIYIILLIGAAYLLQLLSQAATNNIMDLRILGHIGEGFSFAFAILEFISIVENGDKMHVYLPGVVRSVIATLSKYLKESGDQDVSQGK